MMNKVSVMKSFFAVVLAGVGVRLCLLMGEANPKGWEVAAYYVGFFWTLSLVRRPIFRQGYLPKSRLLPVAVMVLQVAMVSLSYGHGRPLAPDLRTFDLNAALLTFFSLAYVASALAVSYGTDIIRGFFRKAVGRDED